MTDKAPDPEKPAIQVISATEYLGYIYEDEPDPWERDTSDRRLLLVAGIILIGLALAGVAFMALGLFFR